MGRSRRFGLVGALLLLLFMMSVPGHPVAPVSKKSPNVRPPPKLNSEVRKISFSGYEWTVRDSRDQEQGPGPNYFEDSSENVWLDEKGNLHLKILKKDDKWTCAEIYSDRSFGHGTYVFQLAPGFEDLDVNVILGLFTYLDDTHEIDIEFARWGHEGNKNGQYVVQPHSHPGNVHRFEFSSNQTSSIHAFSWCGNYIHFRSMLGTTFHEDSDQYLQEWYYKGNDNPEPSTERVHLNLWLMDGLAPSDGSEAEVTIERFSFILDDCDEGILGIQAYWPFILIALLGIAVVIIVLMHRWKKGRD